eukprot:4056227-Amphidinium_carterae.1
MPLAALMVLLLVQHGCVELNYSVKYQYLQYQVTESQQQPSVSPLLSVGLEEAHVLIAVLSRHADPIFCGGCLQQSLLTHQIHRQDAGSFLSSLL